MKLLYCIKDTATPGGMERVLSAKASALVAMGYEVTIVTTDQRGRSPFFQIDPRVQHIDLDVNFDHIPRGLSRWKKYRATQVVEQIYRQKLKALLKDLLPDVAISLGYSDLKWLPKILPTGTKSLHEIHGSRDVVGNLNSITKGRLHYQILSYLKVKLYERNASRFDYNVHLTKQDAESYPKAKISNQVVIPNPIPIPMDTRSSDCSAKRMIVMGRLDHGKNVGELVEIWAKVATQFPDWELAIYGDGYLRSAVEQKVRNFGLEHCVKLYGNTQEAISAYQSASVLLMSSYAEGLPMVMLEAMACGLPIVSYDFRCGPRDAIIEGETGYIIPWGDKDRFAQVLSTLMQDEALRQRMGRRAKEASARFAPQRIMQLWHQLFTEIKNKR